MDQRLRIVEEWIKTVELWNNEKLPMLEKQVEDNRAKLRTRQKEIEKAVETQMKGAEAQGEELKKLKAELEELKKGSVEHQREMMAIGGDVATVESTLGRLEQGITHNGDRVTAVEQNVKNIDQRVTTIATSRASTTSIPASATPVQPRSVSTTGSGSSSGPKLQWTQRMGKMSFEEINVFSKLFRDFCSVARMSQQEERLTLMQSLEGTVLKHAIALPATLTAKEILDRLLDRLKPTQAGAWQRLLKMRQKNGENLNDYIVRFVAAADLLQTAWLNEEQKIEIFLESLARHWCITAKGLKRTMTGAPFEDFVRELASLESGDAMDIDLAKAYEEPEQSAHVVRRGGRGQPPSGQVVVDGRIYFENITNIGRLMVAAREAMKSSPREAAGMRRFLENLDRGTNTRRSHRPKAHRATLEEEFTEMDLPEMIERIDDEDRSSSGGGEEYGACHAARVYHSQGGGAGNSNARPAGRVMKLPMVLFPSEGIVTLAATGLVDTGAEKSIVSEDVVRKLDLVTEPCNSRLCIADGSHVEIRSKATIKAKLKGDQWDKTFNVECLVMPRPGYDILLGMDFLEANDATVHPKKRAVMMNGRTFQCQKVTQEVSVAQGGTVTIGRLTEDIDILPVRSGDRILFSANRSTYPGPQERRLIKVPVNLYAPHKWRRNGVVNPHFSTQLGGTYKDFCSILVTNHKTEPLKITPRTVLFDVGIEDENEKCRVELSSGNFRMLDHQGKSRRFQQGA